MDETERELIKQEREYIKLYKMTKNYNWEIKLYAKSKAEEVIKRLKEIDAKLHQEYDGLIE